jgi:hypothetical protein
MLTVEYNMSPSKTAHDSAHNLCRYFVPCSDFFMPDSRLAEVVNFVHLILCKLCSSMLIPARQTLGVNVRPMIVADGLPFSFRPVSDVVGLRSIIKVILVAARLVVTCVKCICFWPASVFQRERNTRGRDRFATEFEVSVTPFVDAADPRPTRIGTARAIDERPKTLNVVRGKLRVHRKLQSCGAKPGAFTALPGISLPNYTVNRPYLCEKCVELR